MIGLGHYLTVAAIVFTLGVAGIILNRKNIIIIMMSVELILLAVNINLVAFSSFLHDLAGQVFALFILTVAAAEAAIGLAILVTYYRNAGTIAVEDIHAMKGLIPMVTAIVALPLLGFLVAALLGKEIGDRGSQILTTAFLFLAAAFAWIVFFQHALGSAPEDVAVLGDWFTVGALKVEWALRADALTAVMLVVVCTVSSLVHLYSFGYMSDDPGKSRFFAYLSLFTFAMLMLVTADNLVQLFFGWEGVGLASYLLIGFWYEKPTANAAAIKAFVVNRVGDFGFLLGIFTVFMATHSVAFDTIFAAAPGLADKTAHVFGHDWPVMEVACFLLFMGAMGKSAQFMLHTWLPDAMEGPTPVSALIHAATMVTAGVFMVARLSPLFEQAPAAMSFVTIIGGTTCFFAATIGCVQTDIKRVVAYSTCSQLGYMFVGLGVGGFGLGIFHLFTHAFFKALLFLGCGSVITAMHHEQDMRHMGALRTRIPRTYWAMTIGTLALVGFPFTAGWYSKDAIIEAAYASTTPGHVYAWLLATGAVFLTSFYSFRLVFMTFFQQPRWEGAHAHADNTGITDAHGAKAHLEPTNRPETGGHDHVTADHPDAHGAHDVKLSPHEVHTEGHEFVPHEPSETMLIPLYVLSAGALFAGMLFWRHFIGDEQAGFWKGALYYGPNNHILEDMEKVPFVVQQLPLVMLICGFALAWYGYIRDQKAPEGWVRQNPLLYRFLSHKWYFDELYDMIFVRPAFAIGRLFWRGGDMGIIDRYGPDGISAAVVDVTKQAVKLQTGYVYHYAFAMLIGVTVLITWYLVGGDALMLGFGILSGLILLPLVGTAFILCLRGEDEATLENARWAALITTIVTFLLACWAWANFDASSSSFQFVEEHAWFGFGLSYKLGVDGMSFPFVVLTTFLMPFCIATSWRSIDTRVKDFMVAFLVLETLMIGTFCSLDLVLFYLFFEGGLIPMFLIIGIWGHGRKVYAAFKFFLYTLTGSLLMLLAIMAMYGVAGTTDITVLLKTHFPASMQTWLWLAFFASFAVKMPMWPVHTWLPDAHVEAPTAGSVILAGILLKMGGYGFIRFSLPMFPDASHYFAPLVFTLSVIAIIYTSLVALVQEDMKKLIAYSSVAHMGFVTMGLFSFTEQGIQGAIFQMVSHGLVSGALFLCVGVVYDRMHTREIAAYGGLVHRMPRYATAFLIFTLANVGLPGTSGFVGEFLTMLGTFQVNSWVALFAATGVILSAAYALYLYRRVIFGVMTKDNLKSILDLNARETAMLATLVVLVIFYGFHPSPILDASGPSVAALVKTDEAHILTRAAGRGTMRSMVEGATALH